MKKVIFLTISMLMVNNKAYSINDFEEVKNKVQSASERVSQLDHRLKMLETRIRQETASLEQIGGNPEYANDFQQRQETIRSIINEYNNLLGQRDSSLAQMSKEINSAGHRYHVSDINGKYEVLKPNYRKPAPIVHKAKNYNF